MPKTSFRRIPRKLKKQIKIELTRKITIFKTAVGLWDHLTYEYLWKNRKR